MRGILAEREVVALEIRVDEQLERAFAERSVTREGGRDETPAERFGEQVRGDLATRQRPVREIPQRTLPAPGLVDGERGAGAVDPRGDDEGAQLLRSLDRDLAGGVGRLRDRLFGTPH